MFPTMNMTLLKIRFHVSKFRSSFFFCMFATTNSSNMKQQTLYYIAICITAGLFSACRTSLPEKAEQTTQLSAAELEKREALDFTRSKTDVKSYIRRYIPDVTDNRIQAWTESGELEGKTVNGRFRYFKQAAPNLFRVDSACLMIKEKKDGPAVQPEYEDVRREVPEINGIGRGTEKLFHPVKIKVTYTLTVHPDAVPAGEEIRCWLPFPHQGIPRQQDIRLLSTSEKTYQVKNRANRTHAFLFMKKRAVAGKATVFSEQFEYTSYAHYINVDPENVLPYDTTSVLYKRFTRESRPHLTLSPTLSQLARKITGNEKNPYFQARKLFDYLDRFPWASAREYSTIDNIPEYVLKNKKGDCGQQTLLFVALCRSIGIPAHFQSGFMMHPHAFNLHDWCEIYINGYGWIPVDVSFGKYPYATNEAETYFYFGGIDNYRMVVNQDYSGKLDGKVFPRSETVDFQRGEVEWRGGNLYFNDWSWDVDVTYEDLKETIPKK